MAVALLQGCILRLAKSRFGSVPECTASVAPVDRQCRAIALHRRNHRTALARAFSESRRLRLVGATVINSKPICAAGADRQRAGRLRHCYVRTW